MIRLPPFELQRPRTLGEAAALLGGAGDGAGAADGAGANGVRLVAGGTDLFPNLKRGLQPARRLVSLRGVLELRQLQAAAAGDLVLGATVTLAELARHPVVARRFPALTQAAASISAPALRNMGTIGGNLCLDTRCTYYNQSESWRQAIDYCMKQQGTVCWVAPSSPRCWAVAASDCAPVLCALGATVRLCSARGERTLPVADLYRDDGIDATTRRADEIVAAVLVPASADATRCTAVFRKLRRRGAIDFPVLSVAAAVWRRPGGAIERCAIVLGAVASRPLVAHDAAAAIVSGGGSAEAVAAAAVLCRQAATPLDNTDYAPQWRSHMVERTAREALAACLL